MTRPRIFQAMHPGMSRLERDVSRHHAAYWRPQRFPKRHILRPPAMRMNNIRSAQSVFFDREAFGVCALRQRATGRTDDGLFQAPRPQPLSQLQQGLLPAAPGFGRVNVNDGERSQRNDCSTSAKVTSAMPIRWFRVAPCGVPADSASPRIRRNPSRNRCSLSGCAGEILPQPAPCRLTTGSSGPAS